MPRNKNSSDEARKRYPSDLVDRFVLRMPAGMRRALQAEAIKNRRSMNSEAVFLLANALGFQGDAATGESFPAHPVAAFEQAAPARAASYPPQVK